MIWQSSMRLFIPILLFLFSAVPVFAQDITPSPSSTPSAVISKSDYALPYPGILPDSPLYGLKMIRDRIVLLLISDQTNKVKFNILQSDKRLMAGRLLWNKDHSAIDKAADTASKGQNYFSDAVSLTILMKKSDKDTSSIENDLSRSAKKHIEELEEWSKALPSKDKGYLNPLISKMNSYALQIESLRR